MKVLHPSYAIFSALIGTGIVGCVALNQKVHALVEPHLAHVQNFSTRFPSRLTKMSGWENFLVDFAGSTEGCQGGQGGQGVGSGGSGGGGGERCTG